MVEDKITGIMVYYYHVCKRKLWFFLHGITLEDENEDVQIGKILDETSYGSERKHILINGEINIDFITNTGAIHEIKKSKKIEEASIWQVKYYLYYLYKRGVEIKEAKIDYPLLKKVVDIYLSQDDIKTLEHVIDEIQGINKSQIIPEIIEDKKCKKCAFFDLCFV